MTTAANVAILVGLTVLFLAVRGLALLIGAEEADKALAECDFDAHVDEALSVFEPVPYWPTAADWAAWEAQVSA